MASTAANILNLSAGSGRRYGLGNDRGDMIALLGESLRDNVSLQIVDQYNRKTSGSLPTTRWVPSFVQ